MPSPFPGMDPYLEGRERVSVYAGLSSEIARQLAPLLRPKYVAQIDDAAAAWTCENLQAASRLSRTETNE